MDHRKATGRQIQELTGSLKVRPTRAGEADIAPGTFRVAESVDGTLLGFCDLRLVQGVIEVEALYVDPGAMGGGIGRALWRTAEDLAGECKVRSIGLDADPHAVGFYQHMGAQIVGEAPSGSIPGRFLPRMIKDLVT